MTLTNKLELSRQSLTLMYERDYQNNPKFSGYEYKEVEEDISQRISDLHSFDRGKVYDVVTYSWEEGEDASLEDLNFTMSREDNPITQKEFDSIIDAIIIDGITQNEYFRLQREYYRTYSL